jgi:hypothetical protein
VLPVLYQRSSPFQLPSHSLGKDLSWAKLNRPTTNKRIVVIIRDLIKLLLPKIKIPALRQAQDGRDDKTLWVLIKDRNRLSALHVSLHYNPF